MLVIDNQKNIWMGSSSKGLSVINERTKTITNYQNELYNSNSLSNNFISSIVQNRDGKILIGTNGGGLNVFDRKSNIFNRYITSESEGSLLSNTVQKIYIGHDGIVWIGCWGSGVSMYDKRFEKFTHYKQVKQNVNSLNGNNVSCFAQDLKGNIWIATDGGGITFFNPKENKFIRHLSDINNPKTLTNNKVIAIETDNKGGLWAGMWQGGLNYFQIDGSKLILKKKYTYVDQTSPGSVSVLKIYRNNAGEIWVGNFENGAYLFDPITERFKPMISLKDSIGTINTKFTVVDILSDYKNDVWFATTNGLIRLNRKTGTCELFAKSETDSKSIGTYSISVLFEDSKKRLWVGSIGGGVSLFNRQTNTFTHYTVNQGLPDNSIMGILEDSQHNLWISSHNGLSKATIDSTDKKLRLTFRNYTTQDGLQDKIFKDWAYFKSRSGEMYFGGINGFNAFHPDSIKDNRIIPPVHITDFLLFNKPVLIGAKGSPLNKHISQTKELVLKYDQSIFTFRFVALNYIFSEKNQYAYIMEGLEKEWNYVGNKKEATYTNLNPGKYTFRVKASNNDGLWNEEGTSIKIIILPPWWKTLWFYSICAVIIILVGTSAYKYRIYQLRANERELQRKVNQRTQELALEIAEHQRTEETLRKERNIFRLLIDHIPDVIYVKDTECRKTIANIADVHNMGVQTEAEVLGKTDFDFYPDDLAGGFFADDQSVIQSGQAILNKEEYVINKEGKNIWLLTSKLPLRDEHGQIIGLVGIGRDVTERKQAELEIIKQSEDLNNYNIILNEANVLLEERQQQIEEQSEELYEQAYNLKETNALLYNKQQLIQQQTEKLQETNDQLLVLNATKDRFFSIIAHDLKNPFNSLMGFSELLLNNFEKFPAEKIRKFLQIIYTSSNSGYNLLQNLLQWARTQTGHISFEPVSIKLMIIIEEIFNLLLGEAQQKNITLESSIGVEINLLADENMLRTILRNLVTNAIKFTPANGHILINASVQQFIVEITVADTGVGISEEIMKKLFRIEAIVSTRGTAQEKGTGLGLLLCKEFIDKHGGKIWVESTLGKGSEFKFTLPLV